jgi:hypothetical protein
MFGACQGLRGRRRRGTPSRIKAVAAHVPELSAILDAAKRGDLSRELAEGLPRLGPEAVTLFALAMAAHVAGLQVAAVAAASARTRPRPTAYGPRCSSGGPQAFSEVWTPLAHPRYEAPWVAGGSDSR